MYSGGARTVVPLALRCLCGVLWLFASLHIIYYLNIREDLIRCHKELGVVLLDLISERFGETGHVSNAAFRLCQWSLSSITRRR